LLPACDPGALGRCIVARPDNLRSGKDAEKSSPQQGSESTRAGITHFWQLAQLRMQWMKSQCNLKLDAQYVGVYMGHQQATRLRDPPGRLTHLAGRTGSAAHRSLGPDRSYSRLVRASLASCTIAALGWTGLAGSTRRLDAVGTEEPNGAWLRTGWRRESPAGPTRGVPLNFQKPCVFCKGVQPPGKAAELSIHA
jgi:hypothetical protein